MEAKTHKKFVEYFVNFYLHSVRRYVTIIRHGFKVCADNRYVVLIGNDTLLM